MNLRLDDLGASSKLYERWSRHWWANVWPLHDRRLFGAWGPYRELHVWELDAIFGAVARARRTMLVAVTAYWIDADGTWTPYSEKFPDQARCLLAWIAKGTITFALHGLTHCVPGWHRPRWIGGNRPWHRELTEGYPPKPGVWSGLPFTDYVAPGSPAPPGWRVWHDRDFVLRWEESMAELEEELRHGRF